MVTAIIRSAEDAASLVQAPCRAVALTPAARLALAGASFPVLEARTLYTDARHRRALTMVRAALRRAEAVLEAEAVPPTARETILGRLSLAMGCGARLWATLPGQGPFLVKTAQGWESLDRNGAMLAVLAPLSRPPAPGGTPVLAPLFRVVSRLSAWLAGRRAKGLMLGTFDRGFGPLSRKLALHGTVLSLRMARGNWKDWGALALGLKAGLAGRGQVQLAAVPASGLDYTAVMGRVMAVQPAWLALFADAIARDAALAQGMVNDAAGLMGAARIRTLYSFAMRWLGDAAQAEAAGRLGASRVLISHGSHPDCGDATARFAHGDLARGLLVSPLADVAAVQSPPANALAARLMPSLPRVAVQPLIWGFTACDVAPPQHGPLRLLQAGTFKDWQSHRPWIYETSDEYLHGIATLAAACAGVDGVELVVRARPTPECPLEAIRQAVAGCANVTVKAGGSFLDDLAAAHVLVSYSSTTIEESLAARRPVLLWGGSNRYRHFPARTTPANASGRAAVYGADDAADLPAVIAGLRDCHLGKPLTDAELNGLVWTPPAGGWDALAGCVAKGGRA